MPFLSANIVWNDKAVAEKFKKQKDGKLAVKNEQLFTQYIIKTLELGIKVGNYGHYNTWYSMNK